MYRLVRYSRNRVYYINTTLHKREARFKAAKHILRDRRHPEQAAAFRERLSGRDRPYMGQSALAGSFPSDTCENNLAAQAAEGSTPSQCQSQRLALHERSQQIANGQSQSEHDWLKIHKAIESATDVADISSASAEFADVRKNPLNHSEGVRSRKAAVLSFVTVWRNEHEVKMLVPNQPEVD